MALDGGPIRGDPPGDGGPAILLPTQYCLGRSYGLPILITIPVLIIFLLFSEPISRASPRAVLRDNQCSVVNKFDLYFI